MASRLKINTLSSMPIHLIHRSLTCKPTHGCNIFFLAIVTILLSCAKKDATNRKCEALPDLPDRYIYPVVPGTTAWDAARSIDSLFSLSQIPPHVLQNMSTAGLVQSCMDHPMQLHQLAFNSRVQGRDYLFSRINAFIELSIRPDAGSRLFQRYQLMQTKCMDEMTAENQGQYSLLFFYTEMLLSKDSVIDDLDLAQQRQFAEIVIQKHSEKLEHGEAFGISRSSGILILASIMIASQYQPFLDELNTDDNVQTFVETGLPPGSSVYQSILDHAKNFTT